MKGVMFNFKMSKALLVKMRLAGKYAMIKYKNNWPMPEIVFPNEVLVKTRLGGICASDLHMASLELSPFATIFGNPQNPFPMGHELVGEVRRIGAGVKTLKEGDRVVYLPLPSCEVFGFQPCASCRAGNPQNCLCLAGVGDGSELEQHYGGEGSFGGMGGGGYCEYLSGFEKQFFKVPEGIPDEVAVLTEPFSVGLHAVLRNMPGDDQQVVIFGAGTIGLMIVAALRLLGSRCKLHVVARYPFQAEAARKLSADEVIVESDRDALYEKVVHLTGGRLFKPLMGPRGVYGQEGPDVIFDAVATERTLDDALHLIRSCGRIVIVGQGYIKTKKVDWSIQTYKEIDIVGALIYGMETFGSRKMHCFDLAFELLKKNTGLFRGLLSRTYAIDRYREALGAVTKKKTNPIIKAAFDYR
jgi:threonine dehydrogenase-like Zn-dependent dehydrogenase